MDPTQANRLNPQAFQIQTPGAGLFRSVGDFGSAIYGTDPATGKLVTYDITSLGKQAILQQKGATQDSNGVYAAFNNLNNGDFAAAGLKVLKDKYGIDYNSLQQVNMGDFIQDLARRGIAQSINADGQLGNFSVQGDFNNLAGQTGASLQSRTLNNTPNTLSTPPAGTQQNNAPGTIQPSQGLQGGLNVPTPGGIDSATGLPWVNPNANYFNQGGSTPTGTTPGNTQSTPTGTTGTTPTSGTSPTSNPQGTALDVATLPPEFQQLYSQLETYLQQLQQRGQVLNPDVNITPEQTLSFLNQAKSEINPYYASQLRLATDTLSKTLNYGIANEQKSETQAQRDYSTNLRTLGESSADRGFAQSGLRQRDEGNLAYDTNTSIQNARDALSYNAGNAASSFAQQYGSANLPSLNIGNAPRALAGQPGFQNSSGSSPLYQLSPSVYQGLKGSNEYQQEADVQNRASQLESAFRTTQGINQARTLTL